MKFSYGGVKFSYGGWCCDPDCREMATKRAWIGVGEQPLVVAVCEHHLGRLEAAVAELRGHDLVVRTDEPDRAA